MRRHALFRGFASIDGWMAETLPGTEYKNCTVQLSSVLEKGRSFLFVVWLPQFVFVQGKAPFQPVRASLVSQVVTYETIPEAA